MTGDDPAIGYGCEGSPPTSRWWWTPPWKVTRPWLPRVKKYEHGDEWCNDTLSIIGPFVGNLVIRYRRGPLRTRPCDEMTGDFGYEPCPFCGNAYCEWLWPDSDDTRAERLEEIRQHNEKAEAQRLAKRALDEQIREGIAEAEAGKTANRGSFAQYLDDGDEP